MECRISFWQTEVAFEANCMELQEESVGTNIVVAGLLNAYRGVSKMQMVIQYFHHVTYPPGDKRYGR